MLTTWHAFFVGGDGSFTLDILIVCIILIRQWNLMESSSAGIPENSNGIFCTYKNTWKWCFSHPGPVSGQSSLNCQQNSANALNVLWDTFKPPFCLFSSVNFQLFNSCDWLRCNYGPSLVSLLISLYPDALCHSTTTSRNPMDVNPLNVIQASTVWRGLNKTFPHLNTGIFELASCCP